VEVLAPGSGYRDYGLAYGGGMAANLRRRLWLAPLLLYSMWRAVRRAARDADLVHAHWLLTAAVRWTEMRDRGAPRRGQVYSPMLLLTAHDEGSRP